MNFLLGMLFAATGDLHAVPKVFEGQGLFNHVDRQNFVLSCTQFAISFSPYNASLEEFKTLSIPRFHFHTSQEVTFSVKTEVVVMSATSLTQIIHCAPQDLSLLSPILFTISYSAFVLASQTARTGPPAGTARLRHSLPG